MVVYWRDGSVTAPGGPATVPVEESRSQIDEQPIPKLGGPTYKHVMPKSYQVLEEQLQSSDTTPAAAVDGTRNLQAHSRPIQCVSKKPDRYD